MTKRKRVIQKSGMNPSDPVQRTSGWLGAGGGTGMKTAAHYWKVLRLPC